MNFINKFKFKNSFSSRNLSKLVLAYFLHMRISTKNTDAQQWIVMAVYICLYIYIYMYPFLRDKMKELFKKNLINDCRDQCKGFDSQFQNLS